jgi:hypothetical protein
MIFKNPARTSKRTPHIDQVVNAVQGNNRCLHLESCRTYTYKMQVLLNVKAVGTYCYHSALRVKRRGVFCIAGRLLTTQGPFVLELKLKMSHYTPRRRSYSFSTSALDRGELSASRPGHALALGKGSPVPIVQEAGWAPEPVWIQRLQEKSFYLCRGSNLDRPFVQPVARHYTD